MCLMLLQILGRNLEGLVARAQELKDSMKDEFVSVSKHLTGLHNVCLGTASGDCSQDERLPVSLMASGIP